MSQPTKEELLFGRIALHNKIISQEQYQECLALRQRNPKHDFGSIFKAKGYLNDKQFRSIRKAQEKHLIKGGLSEEDAAAAASNRPAAAVAAPAPAPAPVEEFSMDDEPEPIQARAAPAQARAASSDDSPSPAGAPKLDASGKFYTAPSGEKVPRRQRPGDGKARQAMVKLMQTARKKGASDIHLSCGSKPMLRLHGGLVPVESMPTLDDKLTQRLVSSVMSEGDWSVFYDRNDWDGGVDLASEGRFRANVLRQRRGIGAVLRIIKTEVPNLKDLGLPESLERFTTYHQGMVLVTGATGSGKSSTLAALIEMINRNRKDHVITLEDPIEFVYQSKQCNVTQRQVEVHTRSWGNALRAALREDPDVILVGEMRDLDTVRLAITASETGHLVFGTLHTTDATRTVDRILDIFPPKEQAQIRAMVSESLKGIISQQLVPRADGKGRVCAYELLFTNPAVANLIRERRTFQLFSVMQIGKKQGMRLMDESLKELLDQKLITKQEAKMRARNPKLF